MQQIRVSLYTLIVLYGFLSLEASAAVLGRYTFTSSNDNVSSVNADVSLTSLSIGPGDPFGSTVGVDHGWSTSAVTNSGGAAASSPVRFVRAANLALDEAGAVAGGDYFQFTLNIDLGKMVSLTTLEFDMAVSTASSNTYVGSWFLRTDVDFNTTVGTVQSLSLTTGAAATSSFSHFSIDLSAPAAQLQNLTGDLVLRLYTFGNSTASGRVNRIDNITLNGNIANVPEPSLSALLVVGLTSLHLLSRRKRFATIR